MAEGEQFTVYNAETQQPLTVTVNQATSEDDQQQGIQGIQYITTQDGVQVQVAQLPVQQTAETAEQIYASLASSGFTTQTATQNISSTSTMPVVVSTPQNIGQSVVQNVASNIIQQQPLQQTSSPQNSITINNQQASITGVPQMLFLNQVTVEGQTHFVLVDANNKPVQLPQGIQVINLPSQQVGGSTLPMPGESGEEPLYVNAKQYHRILKRRQARAKLEALGKIPKERQKYLYESRHKHALNRSRGSGGVFVKGHKTEPADNIEQSVHHVIEEHLKVAQSLPPPRAIQPMPIAATADILTSLAS